jgi:hypothetical protein
MRSSVTIVFTRMAYMHPALIGVHHGRHHGRLRFYGRFRARFAAIDISDLADSRGAYQVQAGNRDEYPQCWRWDSLQQACLVVLPRETDLFFCR